MGAFPMRNTRRKAPRLVSIPVLIAVVLACGTVNAESPGLLSTFDDTSALARDFSRIQRQRGDIDVIADPAVTGNGVARLTAGPKRLGRVGKAALIRDFGPVGAGHVVYMQGNFYFPPDTSLNSIILMDLECASCGPDTNPGIRLYLRDARLRVDRSKVGIRDAFLQNRDVQLRPGRWYEIRWRVVLGDTDTGRSTVWVDGAQVMDASGITLLLQEVVDRYTDRSVKEQVDRFQVGLTANSNDTPQVVLLDNVSLGVQ